MHKIKHTDIESTPMYYNIHYRLYYKENQLCSNIVFKPVRNVKYNMVINVLPYSPIKSRTRHGINSKDRKIEIKFHFLKAFQC
jgi:hypothetical protein